MAWTVLRTVTDYTDYVTAADHNQTRANFDIIGGTDGATKTGDWYVSGNVGVGTTSPLSTLHVVKAAGATLRVTTETGAGGGNSSILMGNQDSGGANKPFILRSINAGLYLGTGDSWSSETGGTLTTRMIIDSAGNVGIGITSPASTLDVAGDVSVRPSTGGAYLTVRGVQAGQNAHLYYYTSNALKWVQYANDSNSRLYILDADSNDGVYIAQNTTSWTANSDARLKDVIGPIENATAKVNALTGVKFTWKRDAGNPDAKVRVGLIAQDVLEVLPESVEADTPDIVTDEETGKVSGGLGVRYTELVPLLVNAIKELVQRVEALEA